MVKAINIFFNHVFVYWKILKNKPRGLYFSTALFEGLIFGGAYLGNVKEMH